MNNTNSPLTSEIIEARWDPPSIQVLQRFANISYVSHRQASSYKWMNRRTDEETDEAGNDNTPLALAPRGENDNKPTPAKTKATRTPAFWGYTLPPHDYPYYWPVHIGSQVTTRQKSKLQIERIRQNFKFLNLKKKQRKKKNNLYAWHTFWSCLIRCINMKWIRQVL